MNFTRIAIRQVVMEALDDLLSDPDCEGVVFWYRAYRVLPILNTRTHTHKCS